MPIGGFYHARAVEESLRTLALALDACVGTRQQIPHESVDALLQGILTEIEKSRVRGPKENEDFQELRGKIFDTWKAVRSDS